MMTGPVLSPDIQRQIAELRAADHHFMVLVVEHDPEGYWPVGMEILAELDDESVPVFGDREGN